MAVTVAELLVLALRVLPGEIREWQKAERNLPEKKKEGGGSSGSARENPGTGEA